MVSEAKGHFPESPPIPQSWLRRWLRREPAREGIVMNIQLNTQGSSGFRPLAGKVSLITGSTSGIGLGIARALAAAGSDVVLNGFGTASDIDATRERLAKDCRVKVGYSAADMSKPEAIEEMIATA